MKNKYLEILIEAKEKLIKKYKKKGNTVDGV